MDHLVLTRLSRLILLLVVGSASLASQVTIDSVASRLHADQYIRLHVRGGRHVEGRFAFHVVAPAGSQLSVADTLIQAETVDSLWVRGRATKTGALVGAVVVGVPAAVFWAAVCSAIAESECTAWGAVAGLTVGTAGIGALLGAGVGTAFPRWQLRYAQTTLGLRLAPLPQQRAGVGMVVPFRLSLH